MRTFVKLREILSTHKELAHQLVDLERRLEDHDEQIQTIFEAIRQLMAPPEKPRKKLVFRSKNAVPSMASGRRVKNRNFELDRIHRINRK